ncbi:dihydroorotase [Salirhabdus salicampi]|uniref:dihydroorotase n=1 Tax=Salirhabdus salicampi TaxID=476102 RepID=UPI0020C1D30D|nr:dihydroorotase [Salirhabdus salicampi]MCP8615961.1 dihydroorotase [Salirhabdus salicampi]
MSTLLKNGKLFKQGRFVEADVYIEKGKVTNIATSIDIAADEVIDVEGNFIIPGLVDLHVHLREPGGETKETIETGTKAAAKGGFTTIAAMPNTRPVPDTTEHLAALQQKIAEFAHVRVLPYAAITERQLGETITDFDALKDLGAFAFTDDGVGVQNAGTMLEAMKRAAERNMSIVAHCEENTLINNGSLHEGVFSEKQNINGIPSVCESVHIARDVLLAEAAGVHYHVCHISTKESVRVVRDAKQAGINVTAEVTPHHLLLCEEDIPGLDANFKMNPPLRGKEDQQALIEGLLDGTIDFIATDHAPHTAEEKALGIERAPFGIVGLETAFPLLYTNLVKNNVLTLEQLVEFLTHKPAESFNLPFGTIEIGKDADITVINIKDEKEIDPTTFASKGKNTPFTGWACQGWPIRTMIAGNTVWTEETKHNSITTL